MAHDKVINFGYFVRAMRERMDLSRTQFIAKAGIKLSERRLWQIEMGMEEPKVLPQKFEAIARALGMDRDGLDKAWQTTPVHPPSEENRPRKFVLDPLTQWLTLEGRRLGITRKEAATRVAKMVAQISAAERDRMYAVKGKAGAASSGGLKMPHAGKDSRMRAAAKTIPGKSK